VGVGIALLLAQLAWVVTGQRPRLWAPFHEHAVYSLRVRLADRELGTEESLQRFGLSTWHVRGDEAWETNDLDFVKHAASREREGTVELQATVNGERQPPWRFP
jgi:hypothetical protein